MQEVKEITYFEKDNLFFKYLRCLIFRSRKNNFFYNHITKNSFTEPLLDIFGPKKKDERRDTGSEPMFANTRGQNRF
ncbi:hypothetical protein H5410_005385 [Solanum commersonii]|uniref:Uncharacterized protein n=1 Tax=Solanum commersonii TaxID=4109 RepID=A0A9J6A831_SOLCO|nr:hypothetical protein H5410_005385 [Solanum commersonii]